MESIDRRQLLRYGAFSSAGALLASLHGPLRAGIKLSACAPLPGTAPGESTLYIFLRGALDGMAALYPHGDPTADGVRGVVQVPLADRLPIAGSVDGYARVSRNIAPLVGAGSADADGRLAIVAQIGNASSGRSHFTEQQIYETAYVPTPPESLRTEGFVPRLGDVSGFEEFGHATVSSTMQRMFASPEPTRRTVHVKSLDGYRLDAVDSPSVTPISPEFPASMRASLATHLAQPFPAGIPAQVAATHDFMLDTEAIVSGIPFTHDPALFPTNASEAGAITPPLPGWLLPASEQGYAFARACEEALAILQNTTCQVAGVQIGGWDTHADQVPRLEPLLRWLSFILNSLYQRTKNSWTTIVVMTEFGRQLAPNAELGTDHGVGGMMFILGKTLKKRGVFNCHGGSGYGALWNPLANPRLAPFQNALEVTTDFRVPLAELFGRRYLLGGTAIDTVMPGWSSLQAGGNPIYQSLNLFKLRNFTQP